MSIPRLTSDVVLDFQQDGPNPSGLLRAMVITSQRLVMAFPRPANGEWHITHRDGPEGEPAE